MRHVGRESDAACRQRERRGVSAGGATRRVGRGGDEACRQRERRGVSAGGGWGAAVVLGR